MDKLELLNLGKDFYVNKKDDGFEVESITNNIAAFISNDKELSYYVTGCYNSGTDWVQFDISELIKLKNFCELIIK